MSFPVCAGGICAHNGQERGGWAGDQPCLMSGAWAPWKKEGDAHAAAGQLSLFAVGAKETKMDRTWVGNRWARFLAAAVRTVSNAISWSFCRWER